MSSERKGFLSSYPPIVYGSSFVRIPPLVFAYVMESRHGVIVIGPRGTIKRRFNYTFVRIYKANDRILEIKGWLCTCSPITSFPHIICRSIQTMIRGVLFGYRWELRAKPNKYISYNVTAHNRVLVITNSYFPFLKPVYAKVLEGITVHLAPHCENTIYLVGNDVEALAKTATYIRKRSNLGRYAEGFYVVEKKLVEKEDKYDSK